MLMNCQLLFVTIFHHLKLELLAQFPASNDDKLSIFMKIECFDEWITTDYFINFCGIFNPFI